MTVFLGGPIQSLARLTTIVIITVSGKGIFFFDLQIIQIFELFGLKWFLATKVVCFTFPHKQGDLLNCPSFGIYYLFGNRLLITEITVSFISLGIDKKSKAIFEVPD